MTTPTLQRLLLPLNLLLAIATIQSNSASRSISEDGIAGIEAADSSFEATAMSICESLPAWKAALHEYTDFHVDALAQLHAASHGSRFQPSSPLPRLTVYRFLPHESQIGIGDAMPGIANALLSSMRRRRVFLLDWPMMTDYFGPPAVHRPFGLNSTVPWESLLTAYGAGVRISRWADDRLGFEGPDPKRDPPNAPRLWTSSGITETEASDVEVFTHLNRGVFNIAYGVQSKEDSVWLSSVLPFAEDGSLLYGCVYRAVMVPTTRLEEAAEKTVALPSRRHTNAPPSLVCMHLRSGFAGDPEELQTTKALDAAAWLVPEGRELVRLVVAVA
jgi:hypothetical protein